LHNRSFIRIAALTIEASLLVWGIRTRVALAGEEPDANRSGEVRIASLAEEADLSRSSAGETFEDNSHSIHDDLSGFESDHGLESEHEGLESDHGGESEHGGGSESGGGDSGGDR
jgi:hypothetical protein